MAYTKLYYFKRNFTELFLKCRTSTASCAYACYAALGANQAVKTQFSQGPVLVF